MSILRTLAVILGLGAWTIPASGADAWPRVRSTNAVLRSALADATDVSQTFRNVIGAIEMTNGIVYVEPGVCRRGVHACLVHSVTTAGGFRFLRILIDIHSVPTGSDRRELMGTIGHELWHAMEVLENDAVTSAVRVFNLYARESPTMREAFETEAAEMIGNRIRSEVR